MRPWCGGVLLIACGGPEDGDGALKDLTLMGPSDVDVVEVSLELGARTDGFDGTVAARVHYPLGLSGGVPLVVLDPGFAVRNTSYHASANHLASWGFAVLAPQYDSGIPVARSHLGLAEDHNAVLDALRTTALPIDVEIDLDRIGAIGHSRGGKQALLAALLDDRTDVVVGWDPVDALPPFGEVDPEDYPSVTPERIPDLAVPALLLGAARGAEGTVPCAPEGDNHRAYAEAAPDGVIHVLLPRSGHNDVLDECVEGEASLACATCVAGDDPSWTATWFRAATLSFLAEHLLEDAQGIAGWLESEAARELAPGARVWVKGQPEPTPAEDTGIAP